ncbi:MAG: hypothetical protein ACLFQX_05710 [Candidatus Kapaibacterium sp.]
MKLARKLLLISLLATFISVAAIAQSPLEVAISEPLIEGDASGELTSHFSIKNSSPLSIDVTARLEINELANGHAVTYCWGDFCYPPQTEDHTSLNPQTIDPGKQTNQMETYAKCYPEGSDGITRIRLVFYDATVPESELALDITFNAGVEGVRETMARDGYSISLPAPNPAIDVAVIDYAMPQTAASAEFSVRDISGNVVYSQNIFNTEGRISVPTGAMASGSYICTIERSGSIFAATSLIISK